MYGVPDLDPIAPKLPPIEPTNKWSAVGINDVSMQAELIIFNGHRVNKPINKYGNRSKKRVKTRDTSNPMFIMRTTSRPTRYHQTWIARILKSLYSLLESDGKTTTPITTFERIDRYSVALRVLTRLHVKSLAQ